MASGYVYACDERGDLTKPVDEDDPERNAISARDVTNLIVDYHVANIPKGLCEGSTSLTSVRFENDRLDSIGDFALAHLREALLHQLLGYAYRFDRRAGVCRLLLVDQPFHQEAR